MSDTGNFMMDKCTAFSSRIMKMHSYLVTTKNERVVSKQVLRSGTSIGANIAEAQDAISQADFISKLSISLKEARETLYWLTLLHNDKYLSDVEYDSIARDCKELVALLTSSLKNLKQKKQ